MTTIHLITKINAPIETVFNNARDISVHIETASKTNEKAIAGITSGLIELNETETWEGKHFGLILHHQSKITEMKFPYYFTDEMVEGCFKTFKHEHTFTHENGITIMEDKLMYETPFGIFGKLFDKLALNKYLTNFLLERNQSLKMLSENQQ
ncbi:SRPBCC family protein [Flavobacterium sp. N2270]|uniref:SRPBCC family protein n=1 Tax=Flavobacterium sp. N2270 TaxID=2986831 RepID=UPI00222462A5|nr:SRPBCC family protein [Flavobacterium sp. N2270]